MDIILDFLRLFLFLFSTYGYVIFIHKKLGIDGECLPAIVVSSIGCLMFLAGILNILNIALYIIFIAGFIFALKDIRCIQYIFREFNLKKGIQFAVLFLMLYLFCYLKDVKYYQYDNFSHWGVVIKNIFVNNSFPNFDDEIIAYQSYPLGSAALIWYICKIIGYTEGKTLCAQSFVMLAYSYSLFLPVKNIKDKYSKIAASLLVLVTNIIIVTYGYGLANGIFNLMVDVLLSSIALSACVIMFYYRDTVHKAILCTCPLLVFVVCVKNSGIMWVVAVFIEAFILWHRELCIKKVLWILGGILGLPMTFRMLWNAHVDMVFAKGDISVHAMTVENYVHVFGTKTIEDIKNIVQAFFHKIVSLDNRIIYIGIGLLCLGIIMFFIDRRGSKQFVVFSFYLALIYFIYQFGNLAMYLFSMPLSEALRMAGYERYVMTLELFLWGLIISIIIVMLGKDYQKHPVVSSVILCCVACFLLVFESEDVVTLRKKPNYSAEERESSRDHLEEIMNKYDLQTGKKVLLYIGNPQDRDVGYRSWMSKYMLYSADVKILNEENVNTLKCLSDYDYTIFLENDEVLQAWLADANLPVDIGECFVKENYNFVKFSDYINNLGDEYILFMSVKDDASVSFDEEMRQAMNNLGSVYDLTGRYRSSYVAIIDNGNVVYENLDDNMIEYSESYDGMSIDIVSAGFYSGNRAQIMIDGIDYSKNSRGINIVAYDKKSRTVKESITFDTWLMNGIIMEK